MIKAVMGGSFGGKGQTVVEPACAFACWKLKQPVMLYMDRADSVIGTRSRNACEMKVETALTREGKILGRRIAADIDGGAYYTNAAAVAMAMAKKLFRMYHMEAQTCHVRTFSQTPSREEPAADTAHPRLTPSRKSTSTWLPGSFQWIPVNCV